MKRISRVERTGQGSGLQSLAGVGWRDTAILLGLRPVETGFQTIPDSLADRWANRPVVDIQPKEILAVMDEVRVKAVPGLQKQRWLDDEELGFPKPLKVKGRNYWRPSDIAAFQERMIKEAMNSRKK
jgi:hypothetical protein